MNLKKIRDAVFPRLCVLCGREPVDSVKFLCEDCLEKLAKEQALPCPSCASTVAACRCGLPDGMRYFRSAFWYKGRIASFVQRHKEANYDEYTEYAARRLESIIKSDEKLSAADAICCVPRSPRKVKALGYDTTRDVAARVSELCGIDFFGFIESRGGRDQKRLDYDGRRKNAAKKFLLSADESVPCGNIILIDDVMTTGATASACAKLLKKAGAASVYGLFLSRTMPPAASNALDTGKRLL